MCFEAKKWDLINEHIILLTKKRGQLKQASVPEFHKLVLHHLHQVQDDPFISPSCLPQAVTKMVQEACTYVDKTPNMETKLKLIDTLRTVTAGKVRSCCFCNMLILVMAVIHSLALFHCHVLSAIALGCDLIWDYPNFSSLADLC